MFIRGVTLLVLSSLALPVGANYDADEMKRLITENQRLFQVTEWHGNEQDKRWRASSAIKWLSVEVDSRMTQVGSAYFSPALRAAAQERCTTIATFALRPTSTEQREAIEKVLVKATQHHSSHYFELSNARFEAVPRLNGAFVRLFCSVSSLQP